MSEGLSFGKKIKNRGQKLITGITKLLVGTQQCFSEYGYSEYHQNIDLGMIQPLQFSFL